LLSFAQFEQEVTGERIRGKIAASKGMWPGSTLSARFTRPRRNSEQSSVKWSLPKAYRPR
jgi:DNA invertase Pin-like site-specific DNA recombinase